jgi:hypothetical protein
VGWSREIGLGGGLSVASVTDAGNGALVTADTGGTVLVKDVCASDLVADGILETPDTVAWLLPQPAWADDLP